MTAQGECLRRCLHHIWCRQRCGRGREGFSLDYSNLPLIPLGSGGQRRYHIPVSVAYLLKINTFTARLIPQNIPQFRRHCFLKCFPGAERVDNHHSCRRPSCLPFMMRIRATACAVCGTTSLCSSGRRLHLVQRSVQRSISVVHSSVCKTRHRLTGD